MRFDTKILRALALERTMHIHTRDDAGFRNFATAVILDEHHASETVVVAAIVHDLLAQSHGLTPTVIERELGTDVLKIVREYAELWPELKARDMTLTARERDELWFKRLKDASQEVLQIVWARNLFHCFCLLDRVEKHGGQVLNEYPLVELQNKLWYQDQVRMIVSTKLSSYDRIFGVNEEGVFSQHYSLLKAAIRLSQNTN